MTNADRIRSMDDKQLAQFICDEVFMAAFDEMCEDYPCSVFNTEDDTLEWLKQPAED